MTCAAHVGTQSQNAASLTTMLTWMGPDINSSEVFTDTSTQSGRVFVRSILKICNFDEDDSGQYTCIVRNSNGMENRTWTVTFPEEPVLPQLAAVSQYDSVTYGHTIYMACAMYGYPQPEITWTRDNTVLDPVSTTVNTTYVTINRVNFTQSYIRICNFQAANVGLYMCTATNRVGTSYGYVNIIPEGK